MKYQVVSGNLYEEPTEELTIPLDKKDGCYEYMSHAGFNYEIGFAAWIKYEKTGKTKYAEIKEVEE